MAALSAPVAGAPTAAKPPPLSSQTHNAPPMTGVPRPASLGVAGRPAATAATPSPPVQNAPQMTSVPRPASFGAAGAGATAARVPSPSPPMQNAPQMTGAPRPVSFGAAGAGTTAARVPSPSPPMKNAPQMTGGPRPVNFGAPVARATAARAPSPSPPMQRQNATPMTGVSRPASFLPSGSAATAARAPSPSRPMQNATPMTGVPRPASFGASGTAATTARGPSLSPPVQNAPSMRGAVATSTRAPPPAPPMQGASPAGMVPAGQSSHTAVTGIPTARPRAPLQHKQMRGARPAMAQAMVPRSSHTTVSTVPTVRPHAPLSTRPQAPNAQGAPSMAMSPGVPTIPTPTGNPHASQQQRAAMARHPAPTSSRSIGGPIQLTEPHAPSPNTGGAGAPPARTMPPPSSQAATSAPPAAAAAAPAMPLQQPQARATRPTQRCYVGVQQDKDTGKWAAACVVDPANPTKHRLVGAFPDEHAAALAHDRLDIAFRAGDLAGVNFRAAFHRVELDFLKLCADKSPDALCGLVAGGDKYDEKYSEFLRTIYNGVMQNSSSCKKFTSVILEFFIARAKEIGQEALLAGGPRLVERFVEMHENKAVTAKWRAWYQEKVEEAQAKQVAAQQQQQQGMANKRKADGEDDREHKRQELDPQTTQVSGT